MVFKPQSDSFKEHTTLLMRSDSDCGKSSNAIDDQLTTSVKLGQDTVGVLSTMALLKTSSLLLLLGFCTFGHAVTTPLSLANQALLLSLHNAERSAVGASNMLAMVWSDTLANASKAILDTLDTNACVLDLTTADSSVGWNTFTFPDTNASFAAAVRTWIQSKVNYTYANNSCSEPAGSCDSYLQIVWSEGNKLGCSYSNCTVTGGSAKTTLLCAYSPVFPEPLPPITPLLPIPQPPPLSSPVPVPLPYLKGKPCTKCSTGTFLCSPTGLCNETCKTCSCKAECKNCGILTSTTECRCRCPVGRTGVDCTGPCNDTLGVCGTTGWDTTGCTDGLHPWASYYCPAQCPMHQCAPSKCPPDFTFYDARYTGNNTNTGSCYRAFFQPLTQSQAATNCSTLTKGKGQLVYLETQQELSAVVQFILNRFPDELGAGAFWIGGCRKNVSNNDPLTSFVWSKTCAQGTGPDAGSKPLLYSNWNTGEPNHQNNDAGKTKTAGEWCVEMFVNATAAAATFPFTSFVWNDVDCNAQRGFYICETDPVCQ